MLEAGECATTSVVVVRRKQIEVATRLGSRRKQPSRGCARDVSKSSEWRAKQSWARGWDRGSHTSWHEAARQPGAAPSVTCRVVVMALLDDERQLARMTLPVEHSQHCHLSRQSTDRTKLIETLHCTSSEVCGTPCLDCTSAPSLHDDLSVEHDS